MSPKSEEARARIIALADERGEFVTDVDGFVYWWPESTRGGHFSAHHLRWLADELDKRNEVWQRQIEEYFNDPQRASQRAQ